MRRRTLGVAVLALSGLAACGGGDETSTQAPAAGPAASAPPATQAAAPPAAPASGAPAPQAPAAQAPAAQAPKAKAPAAAAPAPRTTAQMPAAPQAAPPAPPTVPYRQPGRRPGARPQATDLVDQRTPSPLTITLAGPTLSPAAVPAPSDVPLNLTLRAGDRRRHSLVIDGTTLRIKRSGVGFATLAPMEPGTYPVRIDGRSSRSTLVVFRNPNRG